MTRILIVPGVIILILMVAFVVHWYMVGGSVASKRTRQASPSSVSKPSVKDPAETQRERIVANTPATRVLFVIPEINGSDPGGHYMEEVMKQLQKHLPLGGIVTQYFPTFGTGSKTYTHYVIAWLDADKDTSKDIADNAVTYLRKMRSSSAYWCFVKDGAKFDDKYSILSYRPSDHNSSWKEYNHIKSKTITVSDVAEPREVKVPEPVTVENDVSMSLHDEWNAAVKTLSSVTDEYAKFLFTPSDALVSRRLLDDLTEPATARFTEAYALANALLTDTYPGDGAAREFVNAAKSARRTWDAANDNATRKGEQNIGSNNTPMSLEQVSASRTAHGLLDKAVHEETPVTEASLSWKKALEQLTAAGIPVYDSTVNKLRDGNLYVARVLKQLSA